MGILQSEKGAPDPVAAYLARLAPGSRRAMHQVLRVIAAALGGDLPSVAWHELRYSKTQASRAMLAGRYSPSTANKALSALKGVLQEAFRLGLMDADAYYRASDLRPVKGSRVLRGRALNLREVGLLFGACERGSNQGLRDAAALALCFGGCMRRAEAVHVDVAEYDAPRRTITILGKGNKQRRIYLNKQMAVVVESWLGTRRSKPGPLLLAVNKADRIEHRRLSPEAIAVLLKRLAVQAGVEAVSPHDLRRTFVSQLLNAGADLSTVQTLAGHSNPATTVRYDRRGEEIQRRAVELLAIPTLSTGPHRSARSRHPRARAASSIRRSAAEPRIRSTEPPPRSRVQARP